MLGDDEEARIVDVGDEFEGGKVLLQHAGGFQHARVAHAEVQPAGGLGDQAEHGFHRGLVGDI